MTPQEAKEVLEADLFLFAQYMFPNRYFGDVHRDMFHFFQESLERAMETGEGSAEGALIPRDHQKSFGIAVATAWAITKYPWFTVAYVSSNPTLAERQLIVIKNIFLSEDHREIWPEMLHFEKGRTGKMEHRPQGTWTKTEFSVDHPDRPKSEKDPTVSATSAKSTQTGAHVKLIVFDDLVTNENYASAVERDQIKEVYQSYSSIATTGSLMWAVGTRYGDNDLYSELKNLQYDVYDDDGVIKETRHVWKFFERVVEDSKNRDGTGNFVWPRQKWGDNWYGFNQTELSKKRANSFNLELFYSQYYNDPNAAATARIGDEHFKYIDPASLECFNGVWSYAGNELKLHCGIDLAFTEGSGIKTRRRDSTAIAVVGWDKDGYLYVLDVRRFQTEKAEVYYKNLAEMHDYWGFREATVETNVGGKVVMSNLQSDITREGRNLVLNGIPHTKNSGSKEQRIEMTLEPRYRNNRVFHLKGRYIRELETELKMRRPPHDDLKDALSIAVAYSSNNIPKINNNVKTNALTRRDRVINAATRFRNGRKRA